MCARNTFLQKNLFDIVMTLCVCVEQEKGGGEHRSTFSIIATL